MKKIFTLLAFSILITAVFAKQVDVKTAQLIGKNFAMYKSSIASLQNDPALTLAYVSHSRGNELYNYFYVFNINKDKGFIIVSADDAVSPVLGFSAEGAFYPGNIPAPVSYFLKGYRNQIAYAIENKLNATDKIMAKWVELKNGSIGMDKKAGGVGPLLKTKWDQAPYYNDKCPYDNSYSQRTVTGCVATAMAQVMKYWNFPAKGSGFHSYNHTTYGTLSADFAKTTYNWSVMPSQLTAKDTNVAKLMYHCGVSVNMDYGVASTGGSSAYVVTSASPVTNCAEYALKTYFNYDKSIKGLERSNYTDSKWISMMETQIDSGWPVIYAGFGSGGGHCFVLDGYNKNDYMHFNWGWSGTDNGYFEIDSLNPSALGTGGGSGGFNSSQQAVINIKGLKINVTALGNLTLDSDLTTNALAYAYGRKIIANTHIVNSDTASFTGDVCAAIFDTSNVFIDYVQIKSNITIKAGGYYSAVFTDTPTFGILPGYYNVYAYFRKKGGNWQPLSGTGANSTSIYIGCYGYIASYTDDSLAPVTFVQGKPASVYVNVINVSSASFDGYLNMSLYDLKGQFVDSIQTLVHLSKLPSNYIYLNKLQFTTARVNAKPGTYLLALTYYFKSLGHWYLGGTNAGHQNPIKVTVQAAPIKPDVYENNDSMPIAYSLPASWVNNKAILKTTGSNFHVGSDQDYYKVVLPAGYNYTIGSHIKNSSNDSTDYTVDAVYSYSTDAGTTWSGPYDSASPNNISVKNGGIVYLWVSPKFTGATGTYELDMNLSRTVVSGIEETISAGDIKIFPNPAHDVVYIDFGNLSGLQGNIYLTDVQGRKVYDQKIIMTCNKTLIPLGSLAKGVYILHLQTADKVITKQLVIN